MSLDNFYPKSFHELSHEKNIIPTISNHSSPPHPNISLNFSPNPHLTQFKSNPANQQIRKTLAAFYESKKIPHIIFHGTSGSGKITLVMDFIGLIYQNDKHNIKKNVMIVNCSHGKGIKFIREDLKFFAKTNIQANQGIPFKTILLLNAHHLTIDAQSALRRCIEVFSYNTRFFIVVEDKNKLLNPIVSRFCDIYVPENIDESNNIVYLGKPGASSSNIIEQSNDSLNYLREKMNEFVNSPEKTAANMAELSEHLYNEGFSALDVKDWINQTMDNNFAKYSINMEFYKIKPELRSEKLLIYGLLVIFSDLAK